MVDSLPSPSERRAHPRFDLMAQVRVKRGKVDLVVDLSNISRSGALLDMGSLRAPGWVEPGRDVEIFIIHPEDLDTIEIKGKIVRVQKGGHDTCFGVRFVELSAEDEANIERLIGLARRQHHGPSASARKRPPPLPVE